jgi:hypothetical protein|mmetsp:Transcript_4085/g.4219  ORF Transcript_4085/g.4219 Transcript_4085/m.4219 type:complete len:140 (+) Transcript_4085:154-573(+)
MSDSNDSEKEIEDSEREVEDTEDSEAEQTEKNGKDKTKKVKKEMKKKAPGLNYSAIGIGILFVLPVVCTIIFSAFDYFYPHLALDRLVRGKVLKCYDVAKPNETVDIDKVMKKYNGKYQSLFNNLGHKYAKHPECRGIN